MLVLHRLPGEAIRIDDDIVVHFMKVDGEITSVGIDAPRHIHIVREELYRRMQWRKRNGIYLGD